MDPTLVVFIVDDDPAVGDAIQSVCELKQWPVQRFASAEAFLGSESKSGPGCLILDLRLPGQSGLELQEKLALVAPEMPVILISGHADVESTVSGMRKGALTLLQKPFNSRQIVAAIEEGFGLVKQHLAELNMKAQELGLLSELSDGEVETAQMMVNGKSNKQMATLSGLSIRGIEDRRSRLMKYFGVRSLAEFVSKVKPILAARDSEK